MDRGGEKAGFKLRRLAFIGFAAASMGLYACTRSASTPPPTTGVTEGTPDSLPAQQATMEAVRSALLTQTAQAGEAGGIATSTPTTLPIDGEITATPGGPTAAPLVSATPGGPTAAPPILTEVPPGDVPATYTIREGEWPYCIARRFNVNQNELLNLNGISDGTIVYPGEVLDMPQTGNPFSGQRALQPHPTTYTVLTGDTINSVACKYGDVFPISIAEANGLAAPFTLTPGSVINIP